MMNFQRKKTMETEDSEKYVCFIDQKREKKPRKENMQKKMTIKKKNKERTMVQISKTQQFQAWQSGFWYRWYSEHIYKL